jgi:phage-related protein (TIGR01555 family)
MTIYDILDGIRAFFTRPAPPAAPSAKPLRTTWRQIVAGMVENGRSSTVQPVAWRDAYKPATPKPGVKLAMDAGLQGMYDMTAGVFAEAGLGFLGFAKLAELTQRAEFRLIAEVRAEEMTRKWIKITYAGTDKKGKKAKKAGQDKVTELEQALKDFRLKDVFHEAILKEGFFGRTQIYMDTGATENSSELKTPLSIDRGKIGQGRLKGFRVIEPLWSYPLDYDASNPLRPNFYRPQTWTVQGSTIHTTRLLTLVSMPLPDMLKPSYGFAGLSLIQMAKPYVDNWIRTRQSVSDLLHSFSTMVLMTDLQTLLAQGSGLDDLYQRIEAFNLMRDNKGTMLVNKESEDLKNIAVPLSGLSDLQAQAQEQMCSVSQIPLVKFTGITPSGLNASSDGEIRVFYDRTHAGQEKWIGPHIKTAIDAVQLHLWGEIDPNIGFEFVPLFELTEEQAANIEKAKAETGDILIANGTLDQSEERRRIANDDAGPYNDIDPEDLPEPPETVDTGPDDGE